MFGRSRFGGGRRGPGFPAMLLLALTLTGGCGTTLNLTQPDPKIYGGATMFLPRSKGLAGGAEVVFFITFLPLILLDFPLSFAADTATLPLTLFLNIPDRKASSEEPKTGRCQAIESRSEGRGLCRIPSSEDEAYCARHAALGAELERLGALAEPGDVPQLMDALRHPELSVRYLALERLAIIGEAARPALPAILGQAYELRAVIDLHPRKGVPAKAALAVERIAGKRIPELTLRGSRGGQAIAGLYFLARWGQERTADLRLEALAELERAGVLEAWVSGLGSSTAGQRVRAASTLAALGPGAAPATPKLVELLGDPEPRVRIWAAYTLGCIGPPAASARPALEQAARSADSRLSEQAKRALEKLDA